MNFCEQLKFRFESSFQRFSTNSNSSTDFKKSWYCRLIRTQKPNSKVLHPTSFSESSLESWNNFVRSYCGNLACTSREIEIDLLEATLTRVFAVFSLWNYKCKGTYFGICLSGNLIHIQKLSTETSVEEIQSVVSETDGLQSQEERHANASFGTLS